EALADGGPGLGYGQVVILSFHQGAENLLTLFLSERQVGSTFEHEILLQSCQATLAQQLDLESGKGQAADPFRASSLLTLPAGAAAVERETSPSAAGSRGHFCEERDFPHSAQGPGRQNRRHISL